MVLMIRATASGPRAAMPVVITAWPLGRLWRNSSLSARMRSVVTFMVCLDLRRVGCEDDPDRAAGAGTQHGVRDAAVLWGGSLARIWWAVRPGFRQDWCYSKA